MVQHPMEMRGALASGDFKLLAIRANYHFVWNLACLLPARLRAQSKRLDHLPMLQRMACLQMYGQLDLRRI
jgi:hypothetical protein